MDTTIGTIIRDQIGRRALFMIGAKNLLTIENGLQFKVGRNAKSVNALRITLEPSDTYKVEALRIRNNQPKVVESCDDVYVDSLHGVIESMTGMYTSL